MTVALAAVLCCATLGAGCSILVAVDECEVAADCRRFGSPADDWACNAGVCEQTSAAQCFEDGDCTGGICLRGTCRADEPEPPAFDAGESDAGEDAGEDVSVTPPIDMGTPDDLGVQPDLGVPPETVVVRGPIRSHTRWTSDNTYLLEDLVFVEEGVTLRIDAGTTVLGGPGSALVVKRGGKLEARGTADAPVLFTSYAQPGMRLAGDWGGITLLGDAPVNENNAVLEGIDDSRDGAYGGSNAEWNCGILNYVRIEFAGKVLRPDASLRSLTLAGCGTGTTVDYVHVHRADDDGVAIFGGTVNIKHIMVSRAQDDSLDWSHGWTGKAQFVAVQQDEIGDAGFSGRNHPADLGAAPRSAPRIANYTIVGSRTGAGAGVIFEGGTNADLHHGVIMGHGRTSVDVLGDETGSRAIAGGIDVRATLFFDVGTSGVVYFEDETGTADDDGGFDERDFFEHPDRNNTFGLNPLFARAFDLTGPELVPESGSPASDMGSVPQDPFFDSSATYAGAFAPGARPWTADWTDFPEN